MQRDSSTDGRDISVPVGVSSSYAVVPLRGYSLVNGKWSPLSCFARTKKVRASGTSEKERPRASLDIPFNLTTLSTWPPAPRFAHYRVPPSHVFVLYPTIHPKMKEDLVLARVMMMAS